MKFSNLQQMKVNHIFKKARHKLDQIVDQLKTQENTVREVVKALNGKIHYNGLFKNIVNIEGYSVEVWGRAMDGAIKIGTFLFQTKGI